MMPPGPPTSLPPGLIPPGPPPGPPPKEAFRFNAVGYNKTEEPMLNMQGIEHLLSWYRLLYSCDVCILCRYHSTFFCTAIFGCWLTTLSCCASVNKPSRRPQIVFHCFFQFVNKLIQSVDNLYEA